MKLIRTHGRGATKAASMLAALENRGSSALDPVLPAVKRIVADVRRKGDRALLRYASQFDGLSDPEALRVTREEMVGRVERSRAGVAEGSHYRGRADSPIRQTPTACIVDTDSRRGPYHRPACAPPWLGGLLRSQRPPSASFHFADDRDSRAGSRSQAHRRRLSQARAGNPCRRSSAGHRRVLSRRRRSCRRGACLRNRRPSRASTRSLVPAICTSPPPSGWSPSIAPSTCWPAPPRSSSPASAGAPPISPPTSSPRRSTIPKPSRSSSPRAPISPSRSSPKPKRAAATTRWRAKLSIAMVS